MRRKKIVRFLLSILIGGFFLWLAFQNVDLGKLWEYFQTINYFWLLPFATATLLSHFFRALRWKLLITECQNPPRSPVLFSGVMVGYLFNYVFPRLGEISRSAYVGKRENLSVSNLVGTVILERAIDLACMFLLMATVFVYVIADLNILRSLFGGETIDWMTWLAQPRVILIGILVLAVALPLAYYLARFLVRLATKSNLLKPAADRIKKIIYMFVDGLLAIRKVKKWGRFLLYTLFIWVGYVLMTYFPFGMFDMHETYELGLLDALSVTVISSIGIALPSPGGVGTYHYFVKQALLVLFAVPAVTGLAFAIVLHGTMLILVVVSTPLIVLAERLWIKYSGSVNTVSNPG